MRTPVTAAALPSKRAERRQCLTGAKNFSISD